MSPSPPERQVTMARRHKQFKTYSVKSQHPVEKAEDLFVKRVENILGALSQTLSEMPGVTALPQDLGNLVKQVAKGYVTMTEGARSYSARKGNS